MLEKQHSGWIYAFYEREVFGSKLLKKSNLAEVAGV